MRPPCSRPATGHPPQSFLLAICASVTLLGSSSALAEVDSAGSYTTAVPIEVPAFDGPRPALALVYRSRAGNGPVGLGWSLAVGSTIERRSAGGGGPRLTPDDRFELDGQELLACGASTPGPSCASGGTHAASAETFARVELVGETWTLTSPDGTRARYTPSRRAAGTATSWMVSDVTDRQGRVVTYERWCDGLACFPRRIRYGAGKSCGELPDVPVGARVDGALVQLHWESRPDQLEIGEAGALIVIRQRLRSIEVRHGGALQRVYRLHYATTALGANSVLTRVEEFGDDAVITGDGEVLGGTRAPDRSFMSDVGTSTSLNGPTALPGGQVVTRLTAGPTVLPSVWAGGVAVPLPPPHPATVIGQGLVTADVSGDHLADAVSWSLDTQCTELTIHTHVRGDPAYSTVRLPWPTPSGRCEASGVQARAAELDGDGRSDLLFTARVDTNPDLVLVTPMTDLISVRRMLDGTWSIEGGAQPIGAATGFELPRCDQGDLDGNGLADFACLGYVTGGWELVLAQNAGSGRFVFSRAPAPPFSSSHHLRLFDVDGDRVDDAVVVDLHLYDDDATACPTQVCPHWAYHTGRSRGSAFLIWEAQEDPTFATIGTPWEETSVHDGDFDGDGRRDLLISVSGATMEGPYTRLTTVLGRGRSVLRWESQGQRVTGFAGTISVGDTDRDGVDDLLMASVHLRHDAAACGEAIDFHHTRLFTALGLGTGRFALPADLSVGCQGVDVPWPWDGYHMEHNGHALDTNADGAADFVAAWADGDFWIVRDRVAPHGAPAPGAARSADLDGDGRLDWVTVGYLNPGIEVFANLTQADGSVFPRQSLFAPTGAESARPHTVGDWFVADVGSVGAGPDGRDDLIVIDHAARVVTTLLSRGDGSFTARVKAHDLPTDPDVPNWLALDLDGDGATDLAQVSRIAHGPGVRLRVSTLRARGDGTWLADSAWPALDASAGNSASYLVLDLDGDQRDDLVHVRFDFASNDGHNTIVQVLRSRGDGQFDEHTQRLTQPRIDAGRYVPADANGDGLGDLGLVEAPPGQGPSVRWLVSRGDGSFHVRGDALTGPLSNALEDRATAQLIDVDRDGRSDVVHLATTPMGTLGLVLGWNTSTGITPQMVPGLATPVRRAHQVQVVDVDADGDLDLIRPEGTMPRWLAQVPSARIRSARSELGGRVDVSYGTSVGHHALLPARALATVVTSLETFDGLSPTAVDTVRYAHRGATWDFATHRFLGFRWREITRRRGRALDTFDLDPICGARAIAQEHRDLNGVLVARAMSQPLLVAGPGDDGPRLCLMERERFEECEGERKCRVTGVRTVHDLFGNEVWVHDEGDLADPSDDRLAQTTYVPNLADYVVSLPAETTLSEATAAGSSWSWRVLEARRWRYDQHDPMEPPGPRGERTATEVWDDVAGDFVTSSFRYDPAGNLIEAVGPATDHAPAGLTETTTYDCTFGRFPVQACNGQTCTETGWDLVRGRVTSVTDANGATVASSYDPLGRVTRVDLPGGRFTTTTHPDPSTWGTAGMVLEQAGTDESGDGMRRVWRGLDGLGRTVRAWGEDGYEVETRYDGAGTSVAATSIPTTGGPPSAWVQVVRDAVDRVIEVRLPDQHRRRTEFAIGQVTEIDERGARTVRHVDGHGRIAAVEEVVRDCLTDSAEAICSQERYLTTYGYDGLDRLTWIRDHHGNWTSSGWDSMSRRRKHCSPDGGCEEVDYHPDGRVRSRHDALTRYEFRYDALGRQIERMAYDAMGDKVRTETSWDVDPRTGSPAGASLGRPTRERVESSAAVVERSTRWDLAGAVTDEVRCVDGTCAEVGYGHDAAGRLARVSYPDSSGVRSPWSEEVEFLYDDAGRLQKVPGYIEEVQYDPWGREARTVLANGVVEQRERDATRGWVGNLQVAGAGQVFLEVALGRDPTGAVRDLHLTGTSYAVDEHYQRDDLRRLRHVDSSTSGQVDLEYDAIGNLVADSRRGLVDHTDPRHVHAATSFQTGQTFGYDDRGQLITDDQRDLRWDAEGRLVEVTDRASGDQVGYAYGPGGERAMTRTAGQTLLHLGPLLEYDPAFGVVTYVAALGRVIARRDPSRVEFLHHDHLGSVRAVTDDAGRLVSEQDFDVWGAERLALGQAHTPRGHAGGLTDKMSGLTYLGARYLDPVMGQMISADPIVPDPFEPQLLNPYAFAANDPASLVDPTGHGPEAPDDLGTVESVRTEGELTVTTYRDGTANDPTPDELDAYLAQQDAYAGMSPEARAAAIHDAEDNAMNRWMVDNVMAPLTSGVRLLSVVDPTPIADMAADFIDDNMGWGDSSDRVGGRPFLTVVAILSPSPFGKAKALSRLSKGVKVAKTVRKAAKFNGVLKVRIPWKGYADLPFDAGARKVIVEKYQMANKLLREGTFDARMGATAIEYSRTMSRQYVRVFEKVPDGAKWKIPPGWNVDEYLSRFFGGWPLPFNQRVIDDKLNQFLGSLEHAAVQRSGAAPDAVLKRIEIEWIKPRRPRRRRPWRRLALARWRRRARLGAEAS